MYKEKIVNGQTGEETWRDFTPEEIAAVEKRQVEVAKELEAAQVKEQARQSALSKLIDLGLTEEEIAAL
jgi:hypothetical protein